MNAQNETRSRFSPACARACRQCAQAARHARAESCEWRGDESTRDVHRLHTARLARPRALRRLRARATRPPRAGNRARRRRPGCIVAAKPFGCVSVSPICTHVVCRRGWPACTYSCSGRARALPPATRGESASGRRRTGEPRRAGGKRAAPSGTGSGTRERTSGAGAWPWPPRAAACRDEACPRSPRWGRGAAGCPARGCIAPRDAVVRPRWRCGPGAGRIYRLLRYARAQKSVLIS